MASVAEAPLPGADPGCAICLGTAGAGGGGGASRRPPAELVCGHTFCHGCLLTHVKTSAAARHGASCPLCREEIQEEELIALGTATPDEVPPPPPPHEGDGVPESREERRAHRRLMRAARRAHLKLCPACGAMIERTEGCDHMRCRCGCHFSWRAAESVAPCRRLHRAPGDSVLCYWGGVCRPCSKIAVAKLVLWRVTLAPLAISLGAAGVVASIGAAGVTMAASSIVFGAPAMIYEPVRRVRGRRRNPFTKGMRVGAELAKRSLRVADWLLMGQGN